MTTSGTSTYNLNVSEIALAVLHKAGILLVNQSPTSDQIFRAIRAINLVVKSWRTRGIRIWDLTHTVVAIQVGTTYLGTNGLDWETIIPHTTSATNHPITGSDYLAYYKPLTTATGTTWGSGQNAVSSAIYSLGTNVQDVSNVRLVKSDSTKWLTQITREQWFQLNSKQQTGEPTQYYFEMRGSGENPKLYLFPFPDSLTNYVVTLDAITIAEDMPAGASIADYLQNFNLAIIYSAAVLIIPEYPAIPLSKLNAIKQEANEYTAQAFAADEEEGDIRMIPMGGQ